MKYVFLILHYMVFQETEDCVKSILDNVRSKYDIVIIDNASTNDSGEKLDNKYKDIDNIYVLHTEKNLGFANGNNFGYHFAKQNLNPDFIVCINNDTIIEQPEFLEKIGEKYDETSFMVMGPDILAGKNLWHQNPSHYVPFSLTRLNFAIIQSTFYLNFLTKKRFKLVYRVLNSIFVRINKLFFDENKKDKKDIILHGACVIFSKKYLDLNEDLFFNETFLYFEEDILHFICKSNGWLMIYNPEIKIRHLEDAATNSVVKTVTEKEIFTTSNYIKSAKIFKKLMKENSKNKHK